MIDSILFETIITTTYKLWLQK